MTNAEKYKDKLIEGSKSNISVCTLLLYVRSNTKCRPVSIVDCKQCKQASFEWLAAEYEAPDVDWSTVERGTPVMVKDEDMTEYETRKFFDYEPSFATPFITFNNNENGVCVWEYCELAEDEREERKEPEVDWTKVPRGTLVEIRDRDDDTWDVRKFFDYCSGSYFPYVTFSSDGIGGVCSWKYCRLAEDEK